jgi:hypothetical protein
VISFQASHALGDPRLDEYEMLVYQMGSDASHFLPILELASQRPGIHILHDYTLNPLLAYYYLSVLRQPVAYVRLMEQTYGEWARKYAEETIIGRKRGLWETEELSAYPLFEPVLANALGVVVHSRFYLSAVRRVFSGPSTQIKLALAAVPPPSGRGTSLDLTVQRLNLLLQSKLFHHQKSPAYQSFFFLINSILIPCSDKNLFFLKNDSAKNPEGFHFFPMYLQNKYHNHQNL